MQKNIPKKVSSKTVYKNSYLDVKVDTLELDGKQWEQAYFTKPNNHGVGILPVDETGIYLLHQYRYASQQFLWQIPMGMIDVGDNKQIAAKKELSEEAGMKAGKLTELGSMIAEPGMSPQNMFIFMATDLKIGKQKLSQGEVGMKLQHFTFQEIERMIRKSEIECGFTLSTILIWNSHYPTLFQKSSTDSSNV